MSRLWSFILAVVVVLGVFAPNRASAQSPSEAETRVGGIDLVVPGVVGLGASSSADLYQGAGAFTCEHAVGATLAAEGIAATEGGSVGAMSASEPLLNWSPKSTPTWGHSFLRHGQGPSVTRSLVGRAAGTGEAQGQWLSNQAAADFLSAERPYIQGPTAVQLPPGVGAQVILPNGTIVPAGHALLVPAPGGGFVTAYPFLP